MTLTFEDFPLGHFGTFGPRHVARVSRSRSEWGVMQVRNTGPARTSAVNCFLSWARSSCRAGIRRIEVLHCCKIDLVRQDFIRETASLKKL
ncbi:hypothetical protein [Nitrobacter sp. Nb-311A]|uniref:hypothetical protein n=1 Tax=Nitrobacter sp. Nb-311A TaxID=314253 RepID=UPI001FD8BD16|nr:MULTISPECIES: hypothetical protein [unclassified Nitrobacter]